MARVCPFSTTKDCSNEACRNHCANQSNSVFPCFEIRREIDQQDRHQNGQIGAAGKGRSSDSDSLSNSPQPIARIARFICAYSSFRRVPAQYQISNPYVLKKGKTFIARMSSAVPARSTCRLGVESDRHHQHRRASFQPVKIRGGSLGYKTTHS
jgi:hypothetical protein